MKHLFVLSGVGEINPLELTDRDAGIHFLAMLAKEGRTGDSSDAPISGWFHRLGHVAASATRATGHVTNSLARFAADNSGIPGAGTAVRAVQKVVEKTAAGISDAVSSPAAVVNTAAAGNTTPANDAALAATGAAWKAYVAKAEAWAMAKRFGIPAGGAILLLILITAAVYFWKHKAA